MGTIATLPSAAAPGRSGSCFADPGKQKQTPLPQDQFVLSDFRFLGVVNYREIVADAGTEPPPCTAALAEAKPRSAPQNLVTLLFFLFWM